MDNLSDKTSASPDPQKPQETVIDGFRPTRLQYILYVPGYIVAGIVAFYVGDQSDIGGVFRTWEIWLTMGILGIYTATVLLLAGRIKRVIKFQRVGEVAWAPAIAASLTIPLVIMSFRQHGLSTPTPWLTLWLAAWLISRTFYLGNAARNWTNPNWIRQVINELLRGLLLVQGCILVSLLPALPGAIAFIAIFVVFPLAGLLQRKQQPNSGLH